jgi:predicted nucleotidyltransferase
MVGFRRWGGHDRPLATSLRELDSVRQSALEHIVRAVVAWRPDQTILFGSHARGDAGPDSDLDVLVVLPTDALVMRDIVSEMRLAIGTLPVDYDLVVSSRAEFAWRRDYVGAIEYPAAYEGVPLYGAWPPLASVGDGMGQSCRSATGTRANFRIYGHVPLAGHFGSVGDTGAYAGLFDVVAVENLRDAQPARE